MNENGISKKVRAWEDYYEEKATQWQCFDAGWSARGAEVESLEKKLKIAMETLQDIDTFTGSFDRNFDNRLTTVADFASEALKKIGGIVNEEIKITFRKLKNRDQLHIELYKEVQRLTLANDKLVKGLKKYALIENYGFLGNDTHKDKIVIFGDWEKVEVDRTYYFQGGVEARKVMKEVMEILKCNPITPPITLSDLNRSGEK